MNNSIKQTLSPDNFPTYIPSNTRERAIVSDIAITLYFKQFKSHFRMFKTDLNLSDDNLLDMIYYSF